MDTRSKILTPAGALVLPRGLAIASGAFDALRAEHVRELTAVRVRPLLVVVLRLEKELLPQRARAELVAALRMVDYVVPADSDELETLIGALQPSQVERLEASDARRARQLVEHVRLRHGH